MYSNLMDDVMHEFVPLFFCFKISSCGYYTQDMHMYVRNL